MRAQRAFFAAARPLKLTVRCRLVDVLGMNSPRFASMGKL
jgi:hypothetical protein